MSGSKVELVIDNRERDIIENLKVPYEVRQLPIGDIIFEKNASPVLVIERKTVTDMARSIKDGRYREQKVRLIEIYGKRDVKCMYIVEGFYQFQRIKVDGIPISTILSALVNTQCRDNIFVYHTIDINATLDYLEKLFSKLNSYKDSDFDRSSIAMQSRYTDSSVKSIKSQNIKPSNVMIYQLSQIPRVSAKMATLINQVYPTMKSLCDAYTGDPNVDKKLLAGIGDEKRKIGNRMSEIIWKYLTGIE